MYWTRIQYLISLFESCLLSLVVSFPIEFPVVLCTMLWSSARLFRRNHTTVAGKNILRMTSGYLSITPRSWVQHLASSQQPVCPERDKISYERAQYWRRSLRACRERRVTTIVIVTTSWSPLRANIPELNFVARSSQEVKVSEHIIWFVTTDLHPASPYIPASHNSVPSSVNYILPSSKNRFILIAFRGSVFEGIEGEIVPYISLSFQEKNVSFSYLGG